MAPAPSAAAPPQIQCRPHTTTASSLLLPPPLPFWAAGEAAGMEAMTSAVQGLRMSIAPEARAVARTAVSASGTWMPGFVVTACSHCVTSTQSAYFLIRSEGVSSGWLPIGMLEAVSVA